VDLSFHCLKKHYALHANRPLASRTELTHDFTTKHPKLVSMTLNEIFRPSPPGNSVVSKSCIKLAATGPNWTIATSSMELHAQWCIPWLVYTLYGPGFQPVISVGLDIEKVLQEPRCGGSNLTKLRPRVTPYPSEIFSDNQTRCMIKNVTFRLKLLVNSQGSWPQRLEACLQQLQGRDLRLHIKLALTPFLFFGKRVLSIRTKTTQIFVG
jgi:hypothetical protein